MVSHPDVVRELLDHLGKFPILHRVMRACIFAFAERDYAVGVCGGMAKGFADEYSDIDLLVAGHDASDTAARTDIGSIFSSIGEVIGVFPAAHVGLPRLLVGYIFTDGSIVKVDVQHVDWRCDRIREPLLIVHDPARRIASCLDGVVVRDECDVALLYSKFTCWLWYSYTKIARGELFQAARSLDFSRENALLPCLRHRLGLATADGHRRIEFELPSQEVGRLHLTYPRALERGELLRALGELGGHFAEVVQPMLPGACPEEADMHTFNNVRECIAKHAAGYAVGPLSEP
jgi:predicted nucleotidyltransferase